MDPMLEQEKDSSLSNARNNKLAMTPIPHVPVPSAENKVEPRKKGEVGQEVFLRLLLYFSLSCSDFVANKCN